MKLTPQKKIKTFTLEQDLNTWPLRYPCSCVLHCEFVIYLWMQMNKWKIIFSIIDYELTINNSNSNSNRNFSFAGDAVSLSDNTRFFESLIKARRQQISINRIRMVSGSMARKLFKRRISIQKHSVFMKNLGQMTCYLRPWSPATG